LTLPLLPPPPPSPPPLPPPDEERSLFRGKGYAANAERIKAEARRRSGKT